MTTGEGGMITTNDPRIAELCAAGETRDETRTKRGCAMCGSATTTASAELHAALGLAQLERIDEILSARADVARYYSAGALSLPQLQLLESNSRMKRSWFVYVVRFRSSSPESLRDRVRNVLRDKGIASQIYFTPIHQQPLSKVPARKHSGAPLHRPGGGRMSGASLSYAIDRDGNQVCLRRHQGSPGTTQTEVQQGFRTGLDRFHASI